MIRLAELRKLTRTPQTQGPICDPCRLLPAAPLPKTVILVEDSYAPGHVRYATVDRDGHLGAVED